MISIPCEQSLLCVFGLVVLGAALDLVVVKGSADVWLVTDCSCSPPSNLVFVILRPESLEHSTLIASR